MRFGTQLISQGFVLMQDNDPKHSSTLYQRYIKSNKGLLYGGACGVMEMDTATQVQILNKTDCISHSTNTLGKGMNPIILPLAMGK